jgi:transposase-like protein
MKRISSYTLGTDICYNCKSKNITITKGGRTDWAFDYKCLDCGSQHLFVYGDKMGGGFDVVEYEEKLNINKL